VKISVTEVRLKKGEPLDRALRRFKKKLDREGILRAVKERMYYEKPSEKRRRKEKLARYLAELQTKYAEEM